MTDFEKSVYNSFLATSRSAQNKPFKIRKNFKNFEDSSNYIHLQRLCRLFARNPSITPQQFFLAPYKIWEDGGYFDLRFYTTPKALKIYKLYKQK